MFVVNTLDKYCDGIEVSLVDNTFDKDLEQVKTA